MSDVHNSLYVYLEFNLIFASDPEYFNKLMSQKLEFTGVSYLHFV